MLFFLLNSKVGFPCSWKIICVDHSLVDPELSLLFGVCGGTYLIMHVWLVVHKENEA